MSGREVPGQRAARTAFSKLLGLQLLCGGLAFLLSWSYVRAPVHASAPAWLVLPSPLPALGVHVVALSELAFMASAGFLGGWAANVIKFLKFLDDRQLDEDFYASYGWRPALGAIVGVLATLLVVSGLMTLGSGVGANPDALFLGGVAGLAGLFSKKATQKLDEIAGVLFGTTRKEGQGGAGSDRRPNVPSGVDPGDAPDTRQVDVTTRR